MKILVTGGAGYIGSHACVSLSQGGHEVIVLDNFCNSYPEALCATSQITGHPVVLVEGDVRDTKLLKQLFDTYTIDAVLHFAGLKAVGESVSKPLKYFDSNVGGMIALLGAMEGAGVHTLVFSSSATVYGSPQKLPLTEAHPFLSDTSPYGHSKQIIERMLADLAVANPIWRIACLRYFNPVGAHETGLIGEKPLGVPNNLMPYLADVAIGRRKRLAVFGGDYPTHDGTGIRDYIHVMDLVEGHIAALYYLQKQMGLVTVNLGVGRGLSVLELIRTFEKTINKCVPYDIVDRRVGDVAECWADVTKSANLFGWKAKRSVEQMCRDTWRWVRKSNKI